MRRRQRDGGVKWISEKREGRDGRDGRKKECESQGDGEENEDEYGCLGD